MRETVLLSIESLRFSRKKRRGVSPRRVQELQMEIEADIDYTPIRVNALGDGTYVVKDGRHRIQAHIEAGIDLIYAIIENTTSRILDWLRFITDQPRISGVFYLTLFYFYVIMRPVLTFRRW